MSHELSMQVLLVKALYTPWRHVGGTDYSFTRSEPWHYMEVSGLHHVPAALPSGKNAGFHSKEEAGLPQSWCGCFGEEEVFILLPGFESQVVQPIA